MPVDQTGKYHMNPAGAAMHDAKPVAAAHKPEPGKAEGEHPSHVELHGKHPGPFHTMHHMGTGAEPERREHASLHEAHSAMNEHTGGDGCSGEEMTDTGASEVGGVDDEY